MRIRGLLRCWIGAAVVWAVGIGATTPLRAKVAAEAFSDFDVRSHLPWLVISVLMALVAGGLYQGASRSGLPAAILPVPVLASVLGAAAGFGGGTFTAAVLYVVEGLFGAVIGLLVTKLSKERDPSDGYW